MTKEPTYWREKFRFHTKFINTRVHRIPKASFSKPDSLGRISIPDDFPSHYNPNLIVLNSSKVIGGKEEMMGSTLLMVGSAFSIKITLYSWRKFNPIVLVILIGNLDHFFRSLFNNSYWEIGYFPKKELSFLKLACNLVFYTTCSGGTK